MCAALECSLDELLNEKIVKELFTSGNAPVVMEMFGSDKFRLRADFIGDRKMILDMLHLLEDAAKRSGYEFEATPKQGGKP